MASLEKWVDELQAAVDKLTRRVANAAASAFKPAIETPTDGQILVYDATEEEWKNADVPATGATITISGNIGEFPAEPVEGQIHYLIDGNGNLNAGYRYDGTGWSQLFGFNYDLSDTAGSDIISHYGLYDSIGYGADGDFFYNISENGYQLRTGTGSFTTYFYIKEPVIIDTDIFSGFQVTGKFRGNALDVTIEWPEGFSSGYCGLLMIKYYTDNSGHGLKWQLCRPYLVETNNNALYQGDLVAKGSGSSDAFIITGLKLLKKSTTKRRTKK